MRHRIGIIGNGIVGGSLSRWITLYTDHELMIYDPNLGFDDDISNCKTCFISVPAPTSRGGQDLSIIEESIKRCSDDCLIFIRSTVLPGTCNKLSNKYSKTVCHAPEFLTERKKHEDMKRMDIIVGYPESENDEYTIKEISKHMDYVFQDKKYIMIKKNNECEMGKYIHNCHGAMKVNFFNLAYKVCEQNGIDYQSMMSVVYHSGHVGMEHTIVPGPDGYFGFGGTCFPKDMKAFSEFLNEGPEKNWIDQANIMNCIYRIK